MRPFKDCVGKNISLREEVKFKTSKVENDADPVSKVVLYRLYCIPQMCIKFEWGSFAYCYEKLKKKKTKLLFCFMTGSNNTYTSAAYIDTVHFYKYTVYIFFIDHY